MGTGNAIVNAALSRRVVVSALSLAIAFVLLQSYRASKGAAHPISFSDSLHSFPYLSSSPSYSCPSPHGIIPPIDNTLQQCSPISSANPAFALKICHEPSACNAFTLRIGRTDPEACKAAEARPDPSEDPNVTQLMRNERGPDSFLVRTDGAEKWGSEWALYEGQCTYRVDISLSNAGPVWLTAWHTYENYKAFAETDDDWPEMLLAPLLSEPLTLSLCPDHCFPTPPVPLLPNQTYISYPTPPAYASPPSTLPDCSSLDPSPIPGSYLPAHPLDIQYPPFPLPIAETKPISGLYRFIPRDCEWRHDGLRFANHSRCIHRSRLVQIQGDSHGRVTFDVLRHRLSGRRDVLTKSPKAGAMSVQIDKTEIKYEWDALGDKIRKMSCEEIEKIDTLIISIAAHLAVHWSTARFIDVTVSTLDFVFSCPKVPRKLIYLPAPASVPRRDEFPRKFDDRRTNSKLRYFRDRGVELALERGWSVVDHFALTMPLAMESADQAHFLMTDAIDPLLDEIIGKAALCEEED